MSSDLAILHVVRSLAPSAGGMTESVGQLSDALGGLGLTSEIATVEPGGSLAAPGTSRLHVFPLASLERLRRSPPLRRWLLETGHQFSLLHVHGLWTWTGLYARKATQKHQSTLVISPRGTVEDWSLKQKWVRKKLGWVFWEQENFRSAALFHATSEQEAESLRRLGVTAPIAIVPNGVAHPVAPARQIRRSPRRLLFLSRLHPKKGLDLLVEAWAGLWKQFPDWALDLAGPDEDGFGAAQAKRATQLGIPADRIRFLGPQYGSAKWELYREADLFVLPSHSENFGNVIAEALSQGTPVLTTRQTPWASLESRHCGWWIDVGVEPLTRALRQALALSPAELAAMGDRGRTFVQEQFEWAGVAEAIARCYAWTRDPRSERPAEIHLP